MGYEQAKELTLSELSDVIGQMNKQESERERGEWERIRWLAAVMLAPHAQKGKTIKPKDLIVFPWEEEKPGISAEHEEKLRLIGEKWDKEMKERYGG